MQYDWLSGYWRVTNTVTCAMESRFLNIYSTFFWPLMNECIQNMVVVLASICSVSMPNFTSIYTLVTINQTSKVWNFAGDVHIGYFHSLVFNDFTNFKWIQLSQYWSYCYNSFCILFWILLMWKPFEILTIFELFLDQILWRARNRWKLLTIYLKCAISRKILEVSKIRMTVFR